MEPSGFTNIVYLAVTYALLSASAVTWVFFVQATLSRDRVIE